MAATLIEALELRKQHSKHPIFIMRYPRSMFGNGFMTIHGTRVPVVGVICMDQCMIDVTDILEVEVGDWVTIYGDGTDNMLSVEDVARFGSTNKNEIISQITRRTLKIYRQNGEISKVKNYLDWENFYANNERKGS